MLFLLSVYIFISSCASSGKERDDIESLLAADDGMTESNTIKIGVLLPLKGDLASQGASQKAAIELALSEISTEFQDFTVELDIQDTETDPLKAQEIINNMIREGTRIFLGPSSSGEAQKIAHLFDLGVTFLSPSSTVPLLSVANDTLFRLAPSDDFQAQALVEKVMKEQPDIYRVFRIARNDTWGSELSRTTKTRFDEKTGGGENSVEPEFESAETSIYIYDSDVKDFSSILTNLHDAIQSALEEAKTARCSQIAVETEKEACALKTLAIHLMAFEEAALILETASNEKAFPLFAKIKWYGADGHAESHVLLENPAAATFANKVGLVAPRYSFSPDYAQAYQNFAQHLLDKSLQVDIYAGTSYEALWILANTARALKGKTNGDLWKTEIRTQASAFHSKAVTGDPSFDQYGDRKNFTYAYWSIELGADGPQWVIKDTFSGTSE